MIPKLRLRICATATIALCSAPHAHGVLPMDALERRSQKLEFFSRNSDFRSRPPRNTTDFTPEPVHRKAKKTQYNTVVEEVGDHSPTVLLAIILEYCPVYEKIVSPTVLKCYNDTFGCCWFDDQGILNPFASKGDKIFVENQTHAFQNGSYSTTLHYPTKQQREFHIGPHQKYLLGIGNNGTALLTGLHNAAPSLIRKTTPAAEQTETILEPPHGYARKVNLPARLSEDGSTVVALMCNEERSGLVIWQQLNNQEHASSQRGIAHSLDGRDAIFPCLSPDGTLLAMHTNVIGGPIHMRNLKTNVSTQYSPDKPAKSSEKLGKILTSFFRTSLNGTAELITVGYGPHDKGCHVMRYDTPPNSPNPQLIFARDNLTIQKHGILKSSSGRLLFLALSNDTEREDVILDLE